MLGKKKKVKIKISGIEGMDGLEEFVKGFDKLFPDRDVEVEVEFK